ncbi:ATP-grasp fold amidoligase family protein [Vibrio sp. PNB22_2_2]
MIFFKKIKLYFIRHVISDMMHVGILYRKVFKESFNIKKPRTLNSKIQKLKLCEHDYLHTLCADKLNVRNFIQSKVGEDILIPLLTVFGSSKNISFKNLPNVPFVLKANHNSGGTKVIFNPQEVDVGDLRNTAAQWEKENYYTISREKQYRDIYPIIFAEKLLTDSMGNIPSDFKFHCFNGKVRTIQVDSDRFGDHKRDFYNSDWIKEPFNWCPANERGEPKWPNSDSVLSKPNNLENMISICEALSSDFKYVRVDLYLVDDRVYFGELTFHHGGGFECFFPKEYDSILGRELKI